MSNEPLSTTGPLFAPSSAATISAAMPAIADGPWAVGVSGGADSVALLLLLLERPGVQIHVVHLDHETRGPESTADARFVADLARSHGLACTVQTLTQVESNLSHINANRSARFREARLALFGRVVATHQLNGVVLAHHQDDQAETVMQRLLRTPSPAGLAAMSPLTTMNGLCVARPLLEISSLALRQYLRQQNQPWREDASNASDAYLRNRVRRYLHPRPALAQRLLELAKACARIRDLTRIAAPPLPQRLKVAMLANLPEILARESARRWLQDRGCPQRDIAPSTVARLLSMARDVAGPARADFPGGVIVRRKAGELTAGRD